MAQTQFGEGGELVSFSLEINVGPAESELRRLEMVLYRILGIARRMGLPENLANVITFIQRVIAIVNQLRLAYAALAAARLAAGDPVAWATAFVGVMSSTISMADMAGSYS